MSLFDFFRRSSGKEGGYAPRGEPKLLIDDGDEGDDEVPERRRPARKNGSRPKKKARNTRDFRKWLAGFIFRMSLLFVFWMGVFVAYIYTTLPDITTLNQFKKTPSIIVKSEDGSVMGSYGDVYGDYIPYSQFPQYLINAVVATEDRNFFSHHGIDPFGMARAIFVDIKAHHLVQGGSTITQQVAKNVFLTNERTAKRKLQELVLALELERHYSKQELLTIYLNRVYMGAGNYGVDSASRRYFGHSVREASLPEAAILVGLLKAPTRYAPTSNPDLSEKRATQVLLNMKDAGYLNDKQVEEARSNFGDEDSSYRDHHSFGSFYFTDYVIGQLPQYIGDTKDDIVVTTTLNPKWQDGAEDAINEVMDAKGKPLHASQAAILSMSPDGAIRTMVGGRNYRASQFNRVTQGMRQPGSSFKLFVYLAGIEAGYTPESQMVDQPISVGNWHPRDYTGKYKGTMTLRDAFAESINSIAVQLSEVIGRNKVIDMARRLGITSPMEADPSIALGTNEVTLLEMTTAYAHLASNGMSVSPYAILKVENSAGQVLYERKPVPSDEVLKDSTVRMMNNMLLAVTTSGTGRGAQIGRPVAGKTGTTSDYKDAWFIGFVPQLVTGVWVGNDDNTPMKKVSGATLPASIWHRYMTPALKEVPVADIPNQSGPGVLQSLLPWLFPQQAAPLGQPPVQQPGTVPTPNSSATININTVPNAHQPVPPIEPSQQPQPAQPQPGQIFTAPSVTTAPPTTQGAVPPQAAPPAAVTPPVDQAPPEEQPTPKYDAPQSFWDKVLGN